MKLTLPESILLLALDDENGHVVSCSSTALPYAVAGALLFDLCTRNLVEIRQDKVVDWPRSTLGDPVLDLAIARFKDKAKPGKHKKVSYWIQQIAKDQKETRNLIQANLIRLGAIREEERKALWVIPYRRYPTDDSTIENRLRKDLHDAVLGRKEITTDEAVLLSLIGAAKLEKEVFDPSTVKEAKQVIKKIMDGEVIGDAISEIVKSIQAAVMVSVIVAATAATSS
jgi:hypothetical protein